MIARSFKILSICFLAIVVIGCASMRPQIPVEKGSVEPGAAVARGGTSFKLLGSPISMGKPLPSVNLVDAMTMKDVDLSLDKG